MDDQGLRATNKCCLMVSVRARLPAYAPTKLYPQTPHRTPGTLLPLHTLPCSAFPPGTVYTHCDNLCFSVMGK